MRYLLDVNALIASIWTDHVNHSLADSWIRGKALVSCAVSELGFLRISTHPKALGASMADARKLLEEFLARHKVEFAALDVPVLQSNATKSDEVTDLYLADFAAKRTLKLATLDSNISHPAVEHIK